MRRPRRLPIAVLAVSTVLVVSACGSSASRGIASSANAGAASTTTVSTAPIVRQSVIGSLGSVLVDANGMTLYHNIHESGGAIVCTAGCVSVWAPLSIASGSPPPTADTGLPGVLATVTRPDGARQVTYDGLPLYTFAKDQHPGDVNGQGVGNVWFVVPSAAVPAAGPATTTTVAPTPTTVRSPVTAPVTTAPRAATTAPPATPAPKPAVTSPPATSPPATSPPTTASPPPTTPMTQPCAYPPCY